MFNLIFHDQIKYKIEMSLWLSSLYLFIDKLYVSRFIFHSNPENC